MPSLRHKSTTDGHGAVGRLPEVRSIGGRSEVWLEIGAPGSDLDEIWRFQRILCVTP